MSDSAGMITQEPSQNSTASMQRISSYLTRWRRPRRKRPSSSITASPVDAVPLEIWYEVADHLPVEDIAVLALTCKALAAVFGYTWRTLREPDRRAAKLRFLQRLDRSLPRMLLCLECGIFVWWNQAAQGRKEEIDWHEDFQHKHHERREGRVRLTKQLALNLSRLQLLKRARYYRDKRYGIGLVDYVGGWTEEGWSFQCDLTFSRDEALLRRVICSINVEERGITAVHFAPCVDRYEYGFSICDCPESVLPELVRGDCHEAIHTLPVLKQSKGRFFALPRRKCTVCYTEVAVVLTCILDEFDSYQAAVLQATRWIDLGPVSEFNALPVEMRDVKVEEEELARVMYARDANGTYRYTGQLSMQRRFDGEREHLDPGHRNDHAVLFSSGLRRRLGNAIRKARIS